MYSVCNTQNSHIHKFLSKNSHQNIDSKFKNILMNSVQKIIWKNQTNVIEANLIVFWMRASVSKSTAAVASSITSTLAFLNRALPRHNNCLCPTEKFSPTVTYLILATIFIVLTFSNRTVQFLRKTLDCRLQMYTLQCLPYLVIWMLIEWIQIAPHSSSKQRWILSHESVLYITWH